MITRDTIFNVKNRSTSVAIYKIPEDNIRREFAPGETKRIAFGELEKLTYQPGGTELLTNFLQILDQEPTTTLNIHREPEYDLSEEQIKDLILNGSIDEFLDALDFAPIGVIDLIKSYSVSLPVADLAKRQALKAKLGFDVDSAIKHDLESKEPEEMAAPIASQRRVNKTTASTEAAPAADQPVRRTAIKINNTK